MLDHGLEEVEESTQDFIHRELTRANRELPEVDELAYFAGAGFQSGINK